MRTELPHFGLVEGTSLHLLGVLHGLVNWDIRASHGAFPLLHGATLMINGRRVLVVGRKGSGKTTLSLHLLARGHGFEGDEHLVVLPNSVVARPRTLRVKGPSLTLVKNLPATLRDAPTVPFWDGSLLYSIDPRCLGATWTIRSGALDAIVMIEPDFGARSFANRLGIEEGFRALVDHAAFPQRAIAAELARIRVLAATTPMYSLRLGELEGAEWHLQRLTGA